MFNMVRELTNKELVIYRQYREQLLLDTPFRASVLAEILYPNSRRNDSAGRVFNHAAAYCGRILRRMPGIVEIKPSLFMRFY